MFVQRARFGRVERGQRVRGNHLFVVVVHHRQTRIQSSRFCRPAARATSSCRSHAGLHRPQRRSQARGNFCLSESVKIGEHQRVLLLVGGVGANAFVTKPRCSDRNASLAASETASASSFAPATATRSRAARGAQPIDAAAARQSHQPCKRPSASLVEVCRAPPHLQKHFLQHVFRFLAVVQYTHQQPKQDYAIAVIELRKGRLVLRGDAFQQLNIVVLYWFGSQGLKIYG